MTKKRSIAIFSIGSITLLIGYFNQQLSLYFLNKDALIGLLFATVAIVCFYGNHLTNKNYKLRNDLERNGSTIYNLREQIRNHKESEDLFKEIKTTLNINNPKIAELEKSISLRDDIIKQNIENYEAMKTAYKMACVKSDLQQTKINDLEKQLKEQK